LGGLTPKAAMFTLTKAITDGIPADHAALSTGFTDGTNHVSTLVQSEDGSTGADVNRRGATNRICTVLTVTGQLDGEASFKEWTTNGVVITWEDALDAAYLLTVVFYAGEDVTADVGTHLLEHDQTSAITGLGYEPDLIFVFGHGGSYDTGNDNDFVVLMGIGSNEATLKQGAHTLHDKHGASASLISEYISDERIAVNLYNDGISRTFKINTFDAGGVTFSTKQEGVTDADLWVCYMTLNFGGAAATWLGWVDTRTTIGSQSITDPGFTPQTVITLPAHLDTLNTIERAFVGGVGIGAFDENDEYTNLIYNEDGLATTNTGNVSDDKALIILDETGAVDVVAAFTSFDANGWTWNYSAVNLTAQKVLCLAIEETDGSGAASYDLVPSDSYILLAADNVTVEYETTDDLIPSDSYILLAADNVTVEYMEIHDLVPSDSYILLAADNVTVEYMEIHDLVPDDSYILLAADNVTVEYETTDDLIPSDSYILLAADNVTVEYETTDDLIPSDSYIADNVTVEYIAGYSLIPSDSYILLAADNVTVEYETTDDLVPSDSYILLAADNVTVEYETTDDLIPSGSYILLAADNVTVEYMEIHDLVPSDSHILLVADNVTVGYAEGYSIIPSDSYILLAADNVTVEYETTDDLVPDDSYILLAADNVTVEYVGSYNLVPSDSYILLAADNVTMEYETTDDLVLSDSHIILAADNVTIAYQEIHDLVLSDSYILLAADNVTVEYVEVYDLVSSDSYILLAADNVTIAYIEIHNLIPSDSYILLAADNVIIEYDATYDLVLSDSYILLAADNVTVVFAEVYDIIPDDSYIDVIAANIDITTGDGGINLVIPKSYIDYYVRCNNMTINYIPTYYVLPSNSYISLHADNVTVEIIEFA